MNSIQVMLISVGYPFTATRKNKVALNSMIHQVLFIFSDINEISVAGNSPKRAIVARRQVCNMHMITIAGVLKEVLNFVHNLSHEFRDSPVNHLGQGLDWKNIFWSKRM